MTYDLERAAKEFAKYELGLMEVPEAVPHQENRPLGDFGESSVEIPLSGLSNGKQPNQLSGRIICNERDHRWRFLKVERMGMARMVWEVCRKCGLERRHS